MHFSFPTISLLVLFFATEAFAHEVKIFTNRQTLPPGGGKAIVFLSWGHRMPVDDFIDASTINRFDIQGPVGSVKPLKTEGLSLQANSVDLSGDGIHTIVLIKKPTIYTHVIETSGERRLKRGTKKDHKNANIDQSTQYLQFAKAMILVGRASEKAPDPVGLPFEIIPVMGPSGWQSGKDISFRVLYEGKAVATAEVLARPVGFKPDEAWSYATESNKDGEFSIRPNAPGVWAIRVHHKTLAPKDERDRFDLLSKTTTLTFEVQQ